jgi:hypothetical protein
LTNQFYQYAAAALRKYGWIRRREVALWNETTSIEGDYLFPVSLDRLPARLAVGKYIALCSALMVVVAYVGRKAFGA